MWKQEQAGKVTALHKRVSRNDGQSDESMSIEHQLHCLKKLPHL